MQRMISHSSTFFVLPLVLVVTQFALADDVSTNARESLDRLAEHVSAGDTSDHGVIAAAIHRDLMLKFSTTERYEFLKSWALPEGSAQVKTVETFCGVEAPPKEFARSIGERPRRNVFSLPSTAGTNGLFSSSWMLIESAKESGKLRTLMEEIESREGIQAKYLGALGRIALRQDVDGFAKDYVQTILRTLNSKTTISSPTVPQTVALLSACLRSGQHQDIVGQIADLASSRRRLGPTLKFRINQLWFNGPSAKSLEPLRINDDWVAVGSKSALYAHEDHLAHVPFGETTYMYRYPVGGDFEFRMDMISPHFNDQSTVGFGNHHHRLDAYWQLSTCRAGFRNANGNTTFVITGHPVASYVETGESPWITFTPKTLGNLLTRYRNLEITGAPKILPEVKLLQESMGNWTAFGDNNHIAKWSVGDSNVSFGFIEVPAPSNPSAQGIEPAVERKQSLIRHNRPLFENETFKYEFFASAETMVHPAIGRLAFLLNKDGVRLHWVTDEPQDWAGLPVDNSIIEPLCRRGPKPLPIKEADWNQLSMSRGNGNLTISLNGTLIYQRSTKDISDSRFGLFHFIGKTKAKIRNAKLTGDWPNRIEQASFSKPIGHANTNTLENWPNLFLEDDLRDDVDAVLNRANKLPRSERFEYLADWVLPNAWKQTVRMRSRLYPLHLPRTANDGTPANRLDSPFIELIKLAKQLGRLDEIDERLQGFSPQDVRQQRRREAALAFVLDAQGNLDGAIEHCEKLFKLNSEQRESSPDEYWPELLVARRFGYDVKTSDVIADMIQAISPQRLKDDHCMRTELFRVRNEIRMQNDLDLRSQSEPIELKQWIATSRFCANRRNQGRGAAEWIAYPGFVHSRGGHDSDMLIYQSPIQGDYELQLESKHGGGACDVYVGGERVQIMANHIFLGEDWSDKEKRKFPIKPPIKFESKWIPHRYVVRDNQCSIYISGRLIHQFEVPSDGFPWVAIHHIPAQFGGVRDVRISGQPTIPQKLPLDFAYSGAWRSYYEVGPKSQHYFWRFTNGEAHGERAPRIPGSGFERLLYYQRPMRDGDSIEYEYFYVPGQLEVHPALDRAAFVIQPDNVGFHRITDGWFDRTFYDKTNLEVRPHEVRAEPTNLLKQNDWNAVRIDVRDGVATLHLNDNLIYEHKLEPENQRLFGLFYYGDSRLARVRNAVMHGNWPDQLPPLIDQELADPIVAQLDRSREELKSQFQHDFAKDGVPKEYFTPIGPEQGRMSHYADAGIGFQFSDKNRWRQSGLRSNVKVAGDFDITAEFSRLRLEDGKMASANLIVGFATATQMTGRVIRADMDNGQTISAQIKTIREDGVQLFDAHKQTLDVDTAILRIARRDTKLHMLVKDKLSPDFRKLKTFDIGNVKTTDVQLLTIGNKAEHASVIWRNIDIRAQRASIGGSEGDRRIFIADADGSNLRLLTPAIPGRGNHGSPEFSPDGTKVAFDTWLGRATNAHIYTINTDGTGLKDLGIGTMPTFSPDGTKIYCSTDDGMLQMNAHDGSERTIITESGWSINVSPQGDKAALYDYYPRLNYFVMDLKTKALVGLMSPEQASKCSQMYWNPDWSPDGKKVAFTIMDRTTQQRELVVADARGAKFGFQVMKIGGNLANDVTWHPDGERIIVRHNDPVRGVGFFAVKPSDPEYDEPMYRSLLLDRIGGIEWSRDGKQIAFAMFQDQVLEATE